MFVQSVFGQFHFVIFRLNLAFPNPGHSLNILQMKQASKPNIPLDFCQWNHWQDRFKWFNQLPSSNSKEFSFCCHKLWFSNPYIFATQCRRPLIFQAINYVKSKYDIWRTSLSHFNCYIFFLFHKLFGRFGLNFDLEIPWCQRE